MTSNEFVFEINGPINNDNQKIACFDYDWTLCKPKDSKTFPSNKDDYIWLRPNVPDIIKQLYVDGYTIYIFTTQTKLWKLDMIKESLATLNIPIKVIVGFGKGDDVVRKPNKALFYDNVSVSFDKTESFFVGDAAGRPNDHSNDDRLFAENVGINFKIPEDIFPIELTKKIDTFDYESSRQEIIILVGYQASGKSTFAANKFSTYTILSGDVLKTLPKMLKEGKKFLNEGKSIVFDATNPKKENRAKIIELANEYKIPVRCFVFNVDIETAMEYNTKRMNETGKKVPKISFYVFRKNYVKPTKEECEIVEINF
jgi:bifunctional polynucleotide phosphatase/kinase